MLRLIRFFTVITLTLALSVILFATMRSAQADTSDLSDAFSITTDDGLSLALSEDGQVVSLAMDGDPLPITPAPALWVRDMSAAGQVSEPNLLTNPGFEDGEIDDPCYGWNAFDGNDPEPIIVEVDGLLRSGRDVDDARRSARATSRRRP